MKFKKAGLVGAVVAASVFFGGCKSPAAPTIDNPPTITTFSASPQSIKQGQSTTFSFSASDDKSLDRAILNYGDGTADTIKITGQTSYSSSKTKTYQTPGVKTAELDIFDNANQKTSKTTTVGVDAILPPTFDKTSLSGIEGQVSAYAKKDIAHDPQGLPLTLSILSTDAHLSISETTDSIKISGSDADVNGSYNFQIKADNGTASATQTLTDIIDARDKYSGRVHDELEGTYIAGLNPELVMQGPLSGWVLLVTGTNSVRAPINTDGTFSLPKVLPGAHRLYRFATNGTDSSFVAYDDFPTGDRVVDAFVSTNAGTDNSGNIVTRIPLQELQDFYVGTNFMTKEGGETMDGKVTGVDFSKVNTYYLAGTDLELSSDWIYLHNTVAQQDSLANTLQQWVDLLPPDKKQNLIIYKAPQGDSIPRIGTRPPPQMGWFFEFSSGGLGSFTPILNGNVCESAIMTYYSETTYGNQKVAQLQEGGSWLCAFGADSDPRFSGKSIFSELTSSIKIMNFDKKLLYIALQHLRAPARQYWSLP